MTCCGRKDGIHTPLSPQRYQNTDVPFQQTAFAYLLRCFWESCWHLQRSYWWRCFFTKTKNNKGQDKIAIFHNEMQNNNTKIMFYQWDIAWTGIIIKQNNNNNNNNNAIIRWLSRFTIYAVFTRNTEKSSIYIRLCWQQHLRAVSH